MRIEAVGLYAPDGPIPKIAAGSTHLAAVDITPLLPEPAKPASLWDIVSPTHSPFADLFNLLSNIVETRIVLIEYNHSLSQDADSGVDYERYLQFPNPDIRPLALTIVSTTDSNDAKMYKIEQWVIEHIAYVSDLEQYAANELWALPTMTLRNREGDCEDGAFLMHSLALHAGIPSERLRTYGGIVVTDDGLGVGGHAWTAYRREIDNEWVITDWCYWPTDLPLDERAPMSEVLAYIDDYFLVQATKTVETPYTNRVRFAASPPAFFIDTIA